MFRVFLLLGPFIFDLLFQGFPLCFGENLSHTVRLEGTHLFNVGDDRQWSRPDLDESGWTHIFVPGSWQSQGVKPVKCMGWYRIHIAVQDDPVWMQPAVMLGRVGNSEEVWINGIKIGGEGVIGGSFVEASWRQRIYHIPEGLLHHGETNLIAIRVMNTYRHGGLLDGPVVIGEYGELLASKFERESGRKAMEVGLSALFLFSFLSVLFLYIADVNETAYLAFAAFLLLCGLALVLDSLFFYDTGLKTALVQRIINASTAFMPAVGLIFLLGLYRMPVRFWTGGVMVLYGLIGLALLFPIKIEVYVFLVQAWSFLTAITTAILLFHAVSAWRNNLHESVPVLTGFAGVIVGVILEIVDIVHPRYFQDLAAIEYGLGFFLVCTTYALMARYGRIRRELRQLSGRILDAHEEERKRLSREIHDGIGQHLLGIKLHLQMLQSRDGGRSAVEKDLLSKLVSEVSLSVAELRRVAMDLRPAFLEESALADVFSWYGENFTQKTGIPLNIDAEVNSEPSLRTKDHLYRIFQETLSNLGRHSEASLVNVTLKGITDNKLLLVIADNGKGIDPHAKNFRAQGLGLSTIKERAELLGGSFTLDARPGEGTTIRIEAPVK